MEKLKYIIEDNTIAELLGVQNFSSKESAILELVKNSFDAQASKLTIIFEKDKLIIEDDGIGMNANDVKQHWMHVGISSKEYMIIDNNNNRRVLAGSKGIGRFALSRLGSEVCMYSRKSNTGDKSVKWMTDWSQSTLQENDLLNEHGTRIVIKRLRDRWNKSNVNKLVSFLSRTYNDSLMQINVVYENIAESVERYFAEPILGFNCTSKINLNYSSEKKALHCSVSCDEFSDDARIYCEGINPTRFDCDIDMLSELENFYDNTFSKEELIDILEEIGDFSAEFYFSLKESSSKDIEKFLYKYSNLSGKFDSGIVLYRNSFSISSYDGTKDWLGLGKRSRLSPAAATHPTGSWRIRENQLAGKVEIDKRNNYKLVDLSNRQGLDENVYYDIFIKILNLGITSFERYRQSIIRNINRKNVSALVKYNRIVDEVIIDPSIIKNFTQEKVTKFISELVEFRNENSSIRREIVNTEERYVYDVRILNVLATSGLKATSIAHEMRNDRNKINRNCDNIIEAMKQYGIWNLVNDQERTKYAYSNIPELLDNNKLLNTKIVSFMDTMLMEIEKSQFISELHNVLELLIDIKVAWERDYSWINVKLEILNPTFFNLPEDILKVIFDNLILNSIQQNDEKNHLNILIKSNYINDQLEFEYRDDGKGLAKKYIDNPRKILEVHETTRKRGHGLGMWIVNNTVIMSGGKIREIIGVDGFYIRFSLGGKYNGQN